MCSPAMPAASRFAFNECLRIVKTALTQRRADPDVQVPWTGFELINTFNAWKKTEEPPSNGAGPQKPADGTALANTLVLVQPARMTREPTFTPHPRPEPTTPEKGGAEHSTELFDTL